MSIYNAESDYDYYAYIDRSNGINPDEEHDEQESRRKTREWLDKQYENYRRNNGQSVRRDDREEAGAK